MCWCFFLCCFFFKYTATTAIYTLSLHAALPIYINSFLPDYLKKEILPSDPFQALDQTGVGQLVEMGVKKGRSTRPGLKVGICGEHGGDPSSIDFFHRVGLDYVSCSPFRVPIARLAAAQAAINNS